MRISKISNKFTARNFADKLQMWIFITIVGLFKTLIIFTYLIILCKGKKLVNFPSLFKIFENSSIFFDGEISKIEKFIQGKKKKKG